MKVIFLDFDGVLNSSASFKMHARKRRKLMEKDPEAAKQYHINEHLCEVCASNFQYILDKCPDAKIVISSAWRNLYELDWLKEKLASYGIDSSKVIDKTGQVVRGFTYARGEEIGEWLSEHPEVTHFAIIDDNHIGNGYEADGKVVATNWFQGLTLSDAHKAIGLLDGDNSMLDLPI